MASLLRLVTKICVMVYRINRACVVAMEHKLPHKLKVISLDIKIVAFITGLTGNRTSIDETETSTRTERATGFLSYSAQEPARRIQLCSRRVE